MTAVLSASGLLSGSERLVLGVSGGVDSLALLHLLTQSQILARDRLIVGHFNHQLRETADQDAAFVAQQSAAFGVSYHAEKADVRKAAAEHGWSLEEAARQLRYGFLARLAREVGAPAVMVAHNADDQAETVLMHFLRGSGLAGLRGMRPDTPLPQDPELRLVRPLLYIGRESIVAYCKLHALQPVVDESNRDLTFFRNRLRHELLPLLESYNPQIRERLQNTAEVLAAEYELLEALRREAWDAILLAEGEEWLRADLSAWRKLPLALRRSTLRHAVWALRRSLRDVSFSAVEAARAVVEDGVVGDQVTLPAGLMLTLGYDSWTVAAVDRPLPSPQSLPQVVQTRPLPVPGKVLLDNDWMIETSRERILAAEEVALEAAPWTVFLAADRLGALVVRSRLPGERFQPLGMEGRSAKVADVMINRKIPAQLREKWPIVANRDHLVWLVGHQIDTRVRLIGSELAVQLRCYPPPS